MAKFNKGGKVRVKTLEGYSELRKGFFEVGGIYEVKGYDSGCAGGNVYFSEDEALDMALLGDDLELVTEANAMTTFKKGDVVVTVDKVGRAVSGQGLVGKGAVGKVKAVEGDKLTVKFGKKQPLLGAATSTRKNFVLRTSEIRLATADEAASIAKKKADEITFEGAKYRKVDRKAQAGDVVVFRNPENDERWITLGKPYEAVTGDDSELEFEDNDGDRLYLYLNERRSTNNTDVYEKVEAEYVPQEGDIVVVTANTNDSRNEVGDLGKVGDYISERGAEVHVINKTSGNGNFTKLAEFRKATPAEVEAYEKALHKASFSVGDYVKLTKSDRGNAGEYAEIIEVGSFKASTPRGIEDTTYRIRMLTGKDTGDIFAGRDEYYAKATEQEVADATKPKLKAGDFVTIDTDRFTADITPGKVYEVFENSGGLYFLDDVEDERYNALEVGAYTIVDADEAKWAKIGRKPGEIRKGDVVKVVSGEGKHPVGTIGIARGSGYASSMPVVANGISRATWCNVELIATVESLFNA